MVTSENVLAPLDTTNGDASHSQPEAKADPHRRKPPRRVTADDIADPLLTVDDVARRLNVSRDWVWDHSSRKVPRLPVIRMGDGALRYRRSSIEDFITERERLSSLRSGQR
jgi:predicted DNA-binding transcriptional regulator AlpA